VAKNKDYYFEDLQTVASPVHPNYFGHIGPLIIESMKISDLQKSSEIFLKVLAILNVPCK
jgi:hypothetical protein